MEFEEFEKNEGKDPNAHLGAVESYEYDTDYYGFRVQRVGKCHWRRLNTNSLEKPEISESDKRLKFFLDSQ